MDILSKSLKEEGVTGKHLAKINVLHIKGWGINNFDDKDLLMNTITNLIKGNRRNNYNDELNITAAINDEEGAISGGHFK